MTLDSSAEGDSGASEARFSLDRFFRRFVMASGVEATWLSMRL